MGWRRTLVRLMPKGHNVSTGGKLERYMSEHGVSKRSLSKKTGLCGNTITAIIRKDRSGMLDSWLKIADAMNCSIDDILCDDVDTEQPFDLRLCYNSA